MKWISNFWNHTLRGRARWRPVTIRTEPDSNDGVKAVVVDEWGNDVKGSLSFGLSAEDAARNEWNRYLKFQTIDPKELFS